MPQSLPKKNVKSLLICFFLFVIIATFIKFQLGTVAPLSVTAPVNVFSSERALNMLQPMMVEQIPHPVDSPANRVVEGRLVGLLKSLGYPAEIQQSQVCRDSKNGFARCTQVRNIIVHIEGTEKSKGILLSAHYDSVSAGPGGSDAGAAVATLLETARVLSLAGQPRNSIVLLFNQGEEFGLFGAKVFIEQHPLAKNLQLAINVEARGSGGKSVMFETGEEGFRSEYYQYQCRGISCAETQLVVNFSRDKPNKIFVVLVYADLPLDLNGLTKLRGEKAVAYQNVDQYIIYTEVYF